MNIFSKANSGKRFGPTILALSLASLALQGCGTNDAGGTAATSAESTSALQSAAALDEKGLQATLRRMFGQNKPKSDTEGTTTTTVPTTTTSTTTTPTTTTTTTTPTTATVVASPTSPTPVVIATPTTSTPLVNPVLFVTQVPIQTDFGSRLSTFSNHLADPAKVPRGGDLMITYPDGSLRNLTKEAGYGVDGLQGATSVAVRDPSVHWSGKKALFSMVVGSYTLQYQAVKNFVWQIYEVSGLGKGEAVSIKPLVNQPTGYNNLAAIYGTDERVLFTSDRPRNGAANLHPQLDEYESSPTVTGLWSLDPVAGDLKILNHTVSGLFSPHIDSFGRIIFTRWDHLQRDQQADADRAAGGKLYGAFNLSDESATSTKLGLLDEVFPEPRTTSTSAYGPVNGHSSNLFSPWQMNEDGTNEVTLNHIGRQELSYQSLGFSFQNDSSLKDSATNTFRLNQKNIRSDTGLFHIKEDPARPGVFYAISAREFGSLTSNQIVSFVARPGDNPEDLQILDFTPPPPVDSNNLAGGRFRNPLPLVNGTMLATHTPTTTSLNTDIFEFRLREVIATGTGSRVAGKYMTPGVTKTASWFDPDAAKSFSGVLWELEPVEVVARTKPVRLQAPALEAPEANIFKAEAVDETAFRSWMKTNELALIVTRNQTSRDRADTQQPYNLSVAGGVSSVSPAGGTVYNISQYQIFQADLVRGYNSWGGRRPIAMPMHDAAGRNPPNPNGQQGSVSIAIDGSTAAFVPTKRALTWQTADASGTAIVRERNWITFQPGEIRSCPACHGVNKTDQAGKASPQNEPEALRQLLKWWKTQPK